MIGPIDLAVRPGEALGVVGPSGAGKSTLARLLVGALAPTSGQVLIGGRPLTGRRAERRVAQLVLQDPADALDPRLTIDAALAPFAGVEARRRGLEAVGLSPAVGARRPHELSGGEKQRVVLARALAVDPEVLVLDEPTSALDRASAARILTLLDGLRPARPGLTLVVVSHELDVVARIADRVLVMVEGRIVEEGPPSAVFGAPAHPATRRLVRASDALTMAMRGPSDPSPAC